MSSPGTEPATFFACEAQEIALSYHDDKPYTPKLVLSGTNSTKYKTSFEN